MESGLVGLMKFLKLMGSISWLKEKLWIVKIKL